VFFFFQAEDGIRDFHVTGVQTCALPIFITHAIRENRPMVSPVPPELFGVHLIARAIPLRDEQGRVIGGVGIGASIDRAQKLSERSEERRVGKECRTWWAAEHTKTKRYTR